MTRRNSHLSLAGPKLKQGESVGDSAGTGSAPQALPREPVRFSPDPFNDLLTVWVDGIIRDLEGLTVALKAWTDQARKDAG